MRFSFLAVIICLSLVANGVAQQEERRPMSTDDGLDMVQLGDVLMSPDGRWVFFSKSELDWKENKRGKTYYMMPADSGDAFRYIGEAGGSSFQFSPDGTYLSFLRKAGDTTQLFIMRTDGGEAVQLTKHKTPIASYRWSGTSDAIFFVADDAKSEEEQKRHKDGYDAIVVDEGPNGQRAASWRNLWKVDIATREESQLTEEPFRIGSFDVSPDGGTVVLTGRYENRRNQQFLSEIFLFDTKTKEKTRLTENRAPESNVLWAPDGERFAYTAPSDSEWDLRLTKLWVMDASTGEGRLVSGQYAGNISGFVWAADGQSLLFTGLQGTNSNLYRLVVESGEVEQLTHEVGSLRAFAFSKDRARMVYAYEDFDTPPDLYTSPTDRLNPTRLTNANPSIETELVLARGEVIRWRSRDGLAIEGILLLPPDHDGDPALPLLLHIHGGPAGVFRNSFSYRNHVWAGLGYAQLLPNVRGSSGYSDDLLRGNMRDIGGGDYWDLMTGVDHVVNEGVAHRDSLGLRGWSYGGILGGWTLTQTGRFKGASLGAMVSDWTSEYGPGFNHDVRLWYIGGTPWERPEEWRRMSSLSHIANVTTPTLLLHGINDRTDTEPQSMMYFTALKDQGKETRYIKFPREPHGFREPRHQRTRDIEEIRWIQKYVRGIEWTPWARTEEEDDEKKAEKVATGGRP
jgi:dipeptidyl aminopeptidase/acylaminoacyl peptidase